MLIYLAAIDDPKEKSNFEKFYYDYRQLLFRVAKNILQDDQLAEDAVQEAFFRIAKNFTKLDTNNCHKTRAYSVVIVENVSRDIYNKGKVQPSLNVEGCELAASGSMEDFVIDKISVEHISKAIGILPEKYRHIIVLKYANGLSDKEIACLLAITQSNVRKRLERGRKLLADKLKEDD